MKKKNKNILWSILAAAVVAVAAGLLVGRKNTTLSADSKGFAVEDTAAIYSIKLTDKLGNSSVLERQGGGDWRVNDKWAANKRQVDILLKTIRLVEVKNPVPMNARNNVVRDMATSAVKVEIFDKDGDAMKTYFVGGPVPDELGTKMLIEGAPEPMVTHIPGFNGYLTPRYVTKPQDWRSSEVYNLNPSTIQQVSITYSGEPAASFTLDVKGDDFILKDPLGKRPEMKLSPLKSKQYLSGFRNVNWELFPPLSQDQKDSILSSTPAATIRVKTSKGDVPLLTLYNKFADQFTKGVGENNLDIDKLYGTYGEGSKEIFLIQIPPLEKILVSYDMIASSGVEE